MNVLLSIAVAASNLLGATRPEDRCTTVDDAQARHYRELGEHLFLAYVDGKIPNYEISPVKCDDDIVVVVIATGRGVRIGDIWTITFDAADTSVTIRRGM